MDKIAAEIFDPLLAGMAGKPLTSAIKAYEDSQSTYYCTILVPLCEAEYTNDNPRDPEARWHEGLLTEEQTRRVYDLLFSDADVIIKIDALARRVAKEGGEA